MARSRECPKCGGAMAEGFVVDKTDSGARVPGWVEGKPQKSVWTGLKLRGKPRLEIVTWRCRRCGFLESYAPDG